MPRNAKPAGVKVVGRRAPPRPVASRAPSRPKPSLKARLDEALEQQAATGDILRVISASRTDVQPVFDAIVRSAVRLCRADHSIAARFDGEFLHALAHHGFSAQALRIVEQTFPMRPNLQNMLGRTALSKRVDNLPDMLADPAYSHDFAMAGGWRSGLAVPMLRDGELIGAIAVSRREPGAFSEELVQLLTTFADQAVIAIENVRLFRELQARNGDLTETLEQQAATSEILRVISSSPTDIQPVFDAIGASAERLCGAEISCVATVDGDLIRLASLHQVTSAGNDAVRRLFPMQLSDETITARTIRQGTVVHVSDVLADAAYAVKDAARAGRFRGCLGVPMLLEGQVIGSIFVARTTPGLFSDTHVALLQTFADQAVIAIENVRLFRELEGRNTELTVALEQQTATSEILRVIASTPNDTQPVFELLAQRAGRLCNAEVAVVSRYEGELIELAAVHGVVPEAVEVVRKHYPLSIHGQTALTARAIRDGVVVHSADVLADSAYATKDFAQAANFRAGVAVPIVREGKVVGSIFAGRAAPGLFSDSQVALLKTFADQAGIAIENVRLFKALDARNAELSHALEQQTATSDILRVISQSPTDTQPVFDTIAAAVLKLCNAASALVAEFDGDMITLAALANVDSRGTDAMRRSFPRRPGRDSATARSILMRDLAAIPDVLADPDFTEWGPSHALEMRSILSVPLMREGSPIGAISVWRTKAGAFPEDQVVLLKTFADQAVIAIENVRLFKALGTRNAELTEALDQQTATGNILRVIGQSQTDAQPVFDTIVSAAMKLCGASSVNVLTYDGELIHLAALVNETSEGAATIRRMWPQRPGRHLAAARAILTREVVCIPDVLEDPEFGDHAFALAVAFRSILCVPLIRDGEPVGAIAVGRPEPGSFPQEQVALLRTFADQAVIAIENVRLFNELEARTSDLTRSVGELRALGEVGQAVSSTLDVETVLSTIVSRANELAGMDGTAIYEYDEAGERFYLRTSHALPDELVEALRADPIQKGEGALGRLAVTFEPVQVPDIVDTGSYQSHVRDTLVRLGYRSLLAIPLLRENHLLGGLVVNCKSAGEFAPQVSELLKTFASQSALAIQNARLFHEIADKSRQLEVASQHKSEFLANMSHELRTPLNAIIGFSEVLAERMFGEINDKQEEYLTDILDSARHLLSLINDILDLSKIEAGRMELNLSDFHLSAAIENTIMLMRERSHRRDIALSCVVDEGLGDIRADERKVKQVLLNLLSNALKFTPEGGRIDVRATRRGNLVEISVADTGVGIDPEDQATVFEEFRQVGSASKRIEGTGLGLAISRKFVELHGGAIRVESEPGKGSTFAFTIPLDTAA